jgi:hypothetical protein
MMKQKSLAAKPVEVRSSEGLGFNAEFQLSVERNILDEQFLSAAASGNFAQRRLGEIDA